MLRPRPLETFLGCESSFWWTVFVFIFGVFFFDIYFLVSCFFKKETTLGTQKCLSLSDAFSPLHFTLFIFWLKLAWWDFRSWKD